jgi:hypothetical protein
MEKIKIIRNKKYTLHFPDGNTLNTNFIAEIKRIVKKRRFPLEVKFGEGYTVNANMHMYTLIDGEYTYQFDGRDSIIFYIRDHYGRYISKSDIAHCVGHR